MKSARMIFLFAIWFCYSDLNAQESKADLRWYNPITDGAFLISGQGWNNDQLANPFDRLPAKAQRTVRPGVWNLSRNSSGVCIEFYTDAAQIEVRYQVEGRLYMYHMAATGVSGVDLYAFDDLMNPIWCRSKYAFQDTIRFQYSNLEGIPTVKNRLRHYRLYLPLYNTVKWLEIGLNQHARVVGVDKSASKPIVVYGTSKTQGACVSRPGLAWTSVLQRAIDKPIINLGFSDNGRIESELIDLVEEIDADLYVVDCMGNMLNEVNFPDTIIEQRIRNAYRKLREAHAETPILFTQHPGLADEIYNVEEKRRVDRVNNVLERVVHDLENEGASRVYMLTKSALGICQECTVDGTHPTDYGMRNYATGYEGIIRTIFEEIGDTYLKPKS
ncbi:SGNH/GDSL hydrolase family protein [Parapedobacter pyrenivorans]|nr:SGNH/GDSL hydrolase family protein [Parapedobacter pyrenivorans]